MKYRFFSVSALSPQSAESELNAFCASHRMASVEKAFILDGTNSYWSFCIGYQDGADKAQQARPGRIDYKEVLDEVDFALLARLRSLRKSLTESEEVPAYALFTNEQLAEMVTKRVTSLADTRQRLTGGFFSNGEIIVRIGLLGGVR